MDFMAPILDFETVAFDMGLQREETASPVSYEAPSAPPNGFTRSAEEADVLVCPNCGDELCSGEAELKKQVWIVKGCGHVRDSASLLVACPLIQTQVYCGECTKGRFVSKAKKAKSAAKTKTFSSCVVDGCAIKTSGKTAMIQLFL
jgi:hypothetical protein